MAGTSVQPYLFFGGRCDEALGFYGRVLGAQVEFLMRFGESPDPPPPGSIPPGFEDKVMHAAVQIGTTHLFVSDGCDLEPKFEGFSLSLALTSEDVDAAVADRERNVFIEQARESGKPENIIEKMVEGRMRKFYEEVVLLKQAFVMNPDVTVEKALEEAAKDIGAAAKLTGFVRFAVGEGVEKEESDFAAEVAAAAKG